MDIRTLQVGQLVTANALVGRIESIEFYGIFVKWAGANKQMYYHASDFEFYNLLFWPVTNLDHDRAVPFDTIKSIHIDSE